MMDGTTQWKEIQMCKTRKEFDAVIQKRSYEDLIKRGNSKE